MGNRNGTVRYEFEGPNGETGYAFGKTADEAKRNFAKRIKTTPGKVKRRKRQKQAEPVSAPQAGGHGIGEEWGQPAPVARTLNNAAI